MKFQKVHEFENVFEYDFFIWKRSTSFKKVRVYEKSSQIWQKVFYLKGYKNLKNISQILKKSQIKNVFEFGKCPRIE